MPAASLLEELGAYIEEGEANPAPDLEDALAAEFVLQTEEWLTEQ